ncbi:MAG: HAD family phosphatase [Micrococcales bacterium]|nr:HAD family phosphatase [Micrococcales bacterium]
MNCAPGPRGPKELKAVLWDLDGTFIDSEGLWFLGITDMAHSFGATWTEQDHQATVGSHLPFTAEMLQRRGVDLPAEEIINRLSDDVVSRFAQAPPFTPGALELARQCAAAGLAQALVTMSITRLTDPLMEVVERLLPGAFKVVITGDAVSHGKPHPEPYLLALAGLGLAADSCLAIEDSPTGVASAMAAGVTTVAVQGHAAVAPQPGLIQIQSLTRLDVSLLRAIHAGQTMP